MAYLSVTLWQEEINEALRDFVEKKGYLTTDRFAVRIDHTTGNVPYTEAVLTGVCISEKQKTKTHTEGSQE